MSKKKEEKNQRELSRREFLRDAGLVTGGALVGISTLSVISCAGETVTTTAPGGTTTKTVTTTAPGGTATTTVTTTAASVKKYVCPFGDGEFDTLQALEDHYDAIHAGELFPQRPLVPGTPPAITGTVIAGMAPHNCGGCCVTRAYVENGVITRIDTETSEQRPDTFDAPQLRACVRCRAYKGRIYQPGRLTHPLKQTKERGDLSGFVSVSWDEALDEVARELKRVYDTYGGESVFRMYGTGTKGKVHGDDHHNGCDNILLSLMGGYLDYHGTYSAACMAFASPFINQTGFTNSMDALVHSKLIIMWGFHAADTIFTANNPWYITQAREAGARVVYIGPQQADTCASWADEWIPVYPGTDMALGMAMIYVMIDEGLLDPSFIKTFVHGFYDDPDNGVPAGKSLSAYVMGDDDRLVRAGLNKATCQYPNTGTLVKYPFKKHTRVPKTPEWAAKICGCSASAIKKLAREYADTSKPAYLMMPYGIQRAAEGEQPVLLNSTLPAITGQWGKLGAGAGWAGGSKSYPFKARINFLGGNKALKFIPVDYYLDAACNPGHSEFGDAEVNNLKHGIKFIFEHAGNCLVNQNTDTNGCARVLKDRSKIEYICVVENFMTPSARYADMVLPTAMNWEKDDFWNTWNDRTLGHIRKAIDPPGEAKPEYEIFTELADRLGLKDQFTGGKTEEEWLRELWGTTGAPITYDEFKERGSYVFRLGEPPVVAAKAIRENGKIDLNTPGLFFQTKETPNCKMTGKVHVYTAAMVDYYENLGAGHPNKDDDGDPIVYPIPMYFPSWDGVEDPLKARYPLQALTTHSKWRVHSTHNNNPYLRELHKLDADGSGRLAYDADTYGVDPLKLLDGHGLEEVWINAADAQVRGIKHGDKVKVYNDRGAIYAAAYVTHRIKPGVINIHQGSWYEPGPDGVDFGGCGNTLTSRRGSRMEKGPAQQTILCEVVKA